MRDEAWLICAGSSSRGNSYAISTDTGTLLIEAGVPLSKLRRYVSLSDVQGVVVSHHHGDHAKYALEYSDRFPVAGPLDVIRDISFPMNQREIYEGRTAYFGPFAYTPFRVPHSENDGRACTNVGYLIHHEAMGTMLFCTDTYTLPYQFPTVNHFLIEANYDEKMLVQAVEKGKTTRQQADRIRLSHFAFHNTLEVIKQCGTAGARTITLIHLSSRHADGLAFKTLTERMFGVPTQYACAGLKVNITKRRYI